MKRIKLLGLCVVSALTLGAMSASLAQAETAPEFYTKAGIGQTAPSEVKEKDTLGVAFLEGKTSKAKIECKKGSGTSVVNGPKTTKEAVTLFSECEIAGLGLPCENKGAGTKQIETNNLEGELGFIATGKDGIKLKPESGLYLAEFECGSGATKIKVKNELFGEITGSAGKTIAEGKIGASGDIKFSETGGKQKYQKFVGESGEHQLENVVTESGTTHEEFGGQSGTVVVKSTPFAYNIGETL